MPEPIKTNVQPQAPDNGVETPSESSTENKPQGEAGASTGTAGQGKDNQGQQPQEDEFKDLPFHEHPRWKQREQEWNDRFEKQEQQFREDLRNEIQKAITANKPQAPAVDDAAEGPIPVWFGGGKDTPEVRKMWKEYVNEQQKIIDRAEKRAVEVALGKINDGQTTQEKAIDDANKHFETSVNGLEATYGKKIDRNALLKYVLDNQIIDHATQRWDYAKGYRWMMAENGTPVQSIQQGQGGNRQDRKALAGATMKDSGKGNDGSGKTVTSSDDFKDPSKRPW